MSDALTIPRKAQEGLGTYLDGMSDYELLTEEDEHVLGKRVLEGLAAQAELDAEHIEPLELARVRQLETQTTDGLEAQSIFVTSNLRLVAMISKRYVSPGIERADIIQDGNLGLMHAARKFDYRKGFKFSTYAVGWIKQYIQRGIHNYTMVHIPTNVQEDIAALNKTENECRANGLDLDDDAICERLSVTAEQLEELRVWRDIQHTLDLDQPAQSDDSGAFTLADVIENAEPDYETESAAIRRIEIETARASILNALVAIPSDVDRALFKRYCCLDGEQPITQAALAAEFGISESNAHAKIIRARKTVKNYLSAEYPNTTV